MYRTRAAILVVFGLIAPGSSAQVLAQKDRITPLRNTVHPRASVRNDVGLVDPVKRLSYISLLLRRTPAQQIALERLLEEQQDSASPNYHRWLTPEDYADRFGIGRDDLARIAAWLKAEGFKIEGTARGRDWIAFSGMVSQAQTAFHTEFHRYRVDGEDHFANATDISAPEALADLIESIRGFDDFLPKHMGRRPASLPNVTLGNGSHYLAPDDLAAIYNISPLYGAGFDGTGQRLAVVGQSAILLPDIRLFRSTFGLSARDPEVWVLGPDPGITPDQAEANLDIEWAGAVARNATIVYDYAANVYDAVQDVIDNRRAAVLSMSFSGCEAASFSATTYYRAVAQKANAEGITWLASSGDWGAANCDYNTAIAVSGLSAPFPATIPEVTGVGGTEFNEASGSYWSATNSGNWESALGYIPEVAWNDSGLGHLLSSGGGASILFLKPSWQAGPGVPSDGVRDTPDVALAASPNHDGYELILNGVPAIYGGTSAATPVFAGIISILNQYLEASGQPSGLANINPGLYKLAAATSGVFHDVTVGNNIVPCRIGTPNCTTGSFGYSAGPGYDMVTGLGSVNATNLVTSWISASPVTPSSQVVPAIAPNPIYQTAPTADGLQWLYTIKLTESSGIQTALTDFVVGGVSYASQIASFFGSPILPANGSISASLGFRTMPVPSIQTFTFTGVDPGGRQWTQSVPVSFSGPAPPAITPGGIAPLYSNSGTIQPGSWVSIYGTNLAATTAVWKGDFPTSLGNVTVTVNGKLAYLWYVSPTQINFQAPDDVTRGPVDVLVTSPGGNALSTVILGSAGPSISLLDGKHVTAIILRSDGSGAYGNGAYDIAGPTGTSLGYKTVAAQSGDNIIVFGVGFGPTSPTVPAGRAFSGAAPTTNGVQFTINSKIVIPTFSGLSSAGLYQFNLTLPAGLGTGDVPLQASSGGVSTPVGALISLR